MSYKTYKHAKVLAGRNTEFDTLIMAAMLEADEDDGRKLRRMWSEIWDELEIRSNTSEGKMPGEVH